MGLVIDDIEAARGGDRCALERVLAGSRRDLRRFAEMHCAVNDVEDAVQESLLKVARGIRALRVADAYASWLFRIVKRECYRLKRVWRHLRLQPVPAEIEGPHYPPPSGLLHNVAGAMARLPVHYREILLLRDVEGLTLDEIAGRLGLHLEAAKARLHRARQRAREYLTDGSPLLAG